MDHPGGPRFGVELHPIPGTDTGLGDVVRRSDESGTNAAASLTIWHGSVRTGGESYSRTRKLVHSFPFVN